MVYLLNGWMEATRSQGETLSSGRGGNRCNRPPIGRPRRALTTRQHRSVAPGLRGGNELVMTQSGWQIPPFLSRILLILHFVMLLLSASIACSDFPEGQSDAQNHLPFHLKLKLLL